MTTKLYFKHWSEKVKLNFMILSKYILSLIDIGIPLDIIRFINILYLQCEDKEICQKISPCKSLYCKWFFNEQSKHGKKTCLNFNHKKCVLVHCQEIKCHRIICINRFQKSWGEVDDFKMPREGFLQRKIGDEICIVEEEWICSRIFCDNCYRRRDLNNKSLNNHCINNKKLFIYINSIYHC